MDFRALFLLFLISVAFRRIGDRADQPNVGIRSVPRSLVPHLDLLVFTGTRCAVL